jgi:hypothetical protein
VPVTTLTAGRIYQMNLATGREGTALFPPRSRRKNLTNLQTTQLGSPAPPIKAKSAGLRQVVFERTASSLNAIRAVRCSGPFLKVRYSVCGYGASRIGTWGTRGGRALRRDASAWHGGQRQSWRFVQA